MDETKKILVVDDEIAVRNLLFRVLSKEGFSVSLAKDGKDSLAKMKGRHFDLLITDLNMPGVDGVELLKKMKKAGRTEKIIVMTGRPGNRDLLRGDLPPVLGFLHKPFQVHKFLNVVISALALSDN